MKKILTSVFIFMFIFLTIPFVTSASTTHNGNWIKVMDFQAAHIYDHNYCSGSTNSSNEAFLTYQFRDRGSWDDIVSVAKNQCSRDSYYQVQAKSKDGDGQIVTAKYAKNGNYSDATQGAVRGTDYAGWNIQT